MAYNQNGSQRSNDEFYFDLKQQIGVLGKRDSGWTREVNIVAWNGGKPKVDIRDWDPGHERMSKGITLSEQEAEMLAEALGRRYGLKNACCSKDDARMGPVNVRRDEPSMEAGRSGPPNEARFEGPAGETRIGEAAEDIPFESATAGPGADTAAADSSASYEPGADTAAADSSASYEPGADTAAADGSASCEAAAGEEADEELEGDAMSIAAAAAAAMAAAAPATEFAAARA